MRASSVIVAEILAQLKAAIRPGVSTAELDEIAERETRRRKARPAFKGYDVGLEQIADGVWSVFFGPIHLGWLDERDFRIMDVQGKKRRSQREL